MKRWTSSDDEAQHLVSIQKKLFEVGLSIRVEMVDGSCVEGQFIGASFGNDYDGNNLNNLRYYGDVTIFQSDGNNTTFSLLDVKSIIKS